MHSLTERQKEVLCLIRQGKTDKEIGTILDISDNTVGKHVSRMMLRVGVLSRTELALTSESDIILNDLTADYPYHNKYPVIQIVLPFRDLSAMMMRRRV